MSKAGVSKARQALMDLDKKDKAAARKRPLGKKAAEQPAFKSYSGDIDRGPSGKPSSSQGKMSAGRKETIKALKADKAKDRTRTVGEMGRSSKAAKQPEPKSYRPEDRWTGWGTKEGRSSQDTVKSKTKSKRRPVKTRNAPSSKVASKPSSEAAAPKLKAVAPKSSPAAPKPKSKAASKSKSGMAGGQDRNVNLKTATKADEDLQRRHGGRSGGRMAAGGLVKPRGWGKARFRGK
jgi:hypothetical protein